MSARSPETNLIINLFRSKYPKGETVTYEEILALPGVSDRDFRGRVTTALKYLKDQHQMVFRCDRGVGYQPMNDSQIVHDLSRAHKATLRKKAERWRNDLEIVDLAKLSPQDMQQYMVDTVQLRGYEAVLSPHVEHQIAKKINEQPSALNWYQTVDPLAVLGDVS